MSRHHSPSAFDLPSLRIYRRCDVRPIVSYIILTAAFCFSEISLCWPEADLSTVCSAEQGPTKKGSMGQRMSDSMQRDKFVPCMERVATFKSSLDAAHDILWPELVVSF